MPEDSITSVPSKKPSCRLFRVLFLRDTRNKRKVYESLWNLCTNESRALEEGSIANVNVWHKHGVVVMNNVLATLLSDDEHFVGDHCDCGEQNNEECEYDESPERSESGFLVGIDESRESVARCFPRELGEESLGF